jgi:hypothetical protein
MRLAIRDPEVFESTHEQCHPVLPDRGRRRASGGGGATCIDGELRACSPDPAAGGCGLPLVREGDDEVPYGRAMNEGAVAEIDRAEVDAVFVEGDGADRGMPQFAWARETLAGLRAPDHAFLGNHDGSGRHVGAGARDPARAAARRVRACPGRAPAPAPGGGRVRPARPTPPCGSEGLRARGRAGVGVDRRQ